MKCNRIRIKSRLAVLLLASLLILVACSRQKDHETTLEAKDIKAYCIDFNWGEGGPNAFAKPGLWTDANPREHVQWYKDLGSK
mgnify:FL=1